MYVDENYYLNTFEGVVIPDDDIKKCLKLAQTKIDSITFNRIVAIGFDNLTEFQKEKVSEAICYEAEHIFKDGYNNSNKSSISSYDVLDISVNVKDKSQKTKAEKENIDEIAYDLIRQTGLTSRLNNG